MLHPFYLSESCFDHKDSGKEEVEEEKKFTFKNLISSAKDLKTVIECLDDNGHWSKDTSYQTELRTKLKESGCISRNRLLLKYFTPNTRS